MHNGSSYIHQIVLGKGLEVFKKNYSGTFSFSHTFKKLDNDELEDKYIDYCKNGRITVSSK